MLSWINTLPEILSTNHRDFIVNYFEWVVDPLLEFLRKNCKVCVEHYIYEPPVLGWLTISVHFSLNFVLFISSFWNGISSQKCITVGEIVLSYISAHLKQYLIISLDDV